jgi:hypothetical protein
MTLIFLKNDAYFDEIKKSDELYLPEEEVNVELVHYFQMKEGFDIVNLWQNTYSPDDEESFANVFFIRFSSHIK